MQVFSPFSQVYFAEKKLILFNNLAQTLTG